MLDKKIDYSETYYKVLNEKENHHGFQYQDGLNILDKDFDESDETCSEGGLYFTDVNYLPLFFDYGDHIREIKIPNDTKVARNNNKWRADRLTLGKRISKDEYFDTLWNPDKFDWKCSWALAEHCSDYFDKWWDPDKFNWVDSCVLAEHCLDYFDKWWNADKFNWEDSCTLVRYCSGHFDKWWNADKFNREDSWLLTRYCSGHFDKWWNADKFDWRYSGSLAKYCSDYKHIWSKYERKK